MVRSFFIPPGKEASVVSTIVSTNHAKPYVECRMVTRGMRFYDVSCWHILNSYAQPVVWLISDAGTALTRTLIGYSWGKMRVWATDTSRFWIPAAECLGGEGEPYHRDPAFLGFCPTVAAGEDTGARRCRPVANSSLADNHPDIHQCGLDEHPCTERSGHSHQHAGAGDSLLHTGIPVIRRALCRTGLNCRHRP